MKRGMLVESPASLCRLLSNIRSTLMRQYVSGAFAAFRLGKRQNLVSIVWLWSLGSVNRTHRHLYSNISVRPRNLVNLTRHGSTHVRGPASTPPWAVAE